MIERIYKGIDSLNEWTGKIVSWLFIPLMLLIVTDVFTRYVLNRPWFYIEINIQVAAAIAVMGAGYAHLHGSHVGVDVLTSRLSEKGKAVLNIILFPLFFIGIGALLWKLTEHAWDSCLIMERSWSWLRPPIYPLKTIIAIGVAFLFLQGVAEFLRSLSHTKRRDNK